MKHQVNVVFDLDGTLIDSAPIVESILNEMRVELGFPPMLREQILPLLSIGGATMLQCALETDLAEATIALERFRSAYLRKSTPPRSVYPGVTDVLKSLSDANIALSVCTNKPRALAIESMRETGLLGYFTRVCAGDDLPTRKPDPANLKASIAPRASLKPAVFLIGDSTVDQLLAQNSGIPFIFFSGGYNDGVKISRVFESFASYGEFPVQFFVSDIFERI